MEAVQGMNHVSKERSFVVLQTIGPSSVLLLAHKAVCICTGTLTHIKTLAGMRHVPREIISFFFFSQLKLLFLKHPFVQKTCTDASSADYL
jgi:hypothetical protein